MAHNNRRNAQNRGRAALDQGNANPPVANVEIDPRSYHSWSVNHLTFKHIIGPEAKSLLQDNFPHLKDYTPEMKTGFLKLDQCEDHEHGYYAFIRRYSEELVHQMLRAQYLVVDIGPNYARNGTFNLEANGVTTVPRRAYTWNIAPLVVPKTARQTTFTNADYMPHEEVRQQDYDFRLHQARVNFADIGCHCHANPFTRDFRRPVVDPISGELEKCPHVAQFAVQRMANANLPVTKKNEAVIIAVDSIYYPGVKEVIDQYMAEFKAARAYICAWVHPPKGIVTLADNLGEIKIEDGWVTQQMNGNAFPYKHQRFDWNWEKEHSEYHTLSVALPGQGPRREDIHTVWSEKKRFKMDPLGLSSYVIIEVTRIRGLPDDIPIQGTLALRNPRFHKVSTALEVYNGDNVECWTELKTDGKTMAVYRMKGNYYFHYGMVGDLVTVDYLKRNFSAPKQMVNDAVQKLMDLEINPQTIINIGKQLNKKWAEEKYAYDIIHSVDYLEIQQSIMVVASNIVPALRDPIFLNVLTSPALIASNALLKGKARISHDRLSNSQSNLQNWWHKKKAELRGEPVNFSPYEKGTAIFTAVCFHIMFLLLWLSAYKLRNYADNFQLNPIKHFFGSLYVTFYNYIFQEGTLLLPLWYFTIKLFAKKDYQLGVDILLFFWTLVNLILPGIWAVVQAAPRSCVEISDFVFCLDDTGSLDFFTGIHIGTPQTQFRLLVSLILLLISISNIFGLKLFHRIWASTAFGNSFEAHMTFYLYLCVVVIPLSILYLLTGEAPWDIAKDCLFGPPDERGTPRWVIWTMYYLHAVVSHGLLLYVYSLVFYPILWPTTKLAQFILRLFFTRPIKRIMKYFNLMIAAIATIASLFWAGMLIFEYYSLTCVSLVGTVAIDKGDEIPRLSQLGNGAMLILITIALTIHSLSYRWYLRIRRDINSGRYFRRWSIQENWRQFSCALSCLITLATGFFLFQCVAAYLIVKSYDELILTNYTHYERAFAIYMAIIALNMHIQERIYKPFYTYAWLVLSFLFTIHLFDWAQYYALSKIGVNGKHTEPISVLVDSEWTYAVSALAAPLCYLTFKHLNSRFESEPLIIPAVCLHPVHIRRLRPDELNGNIVWIESPKVYDPYTYSSANAFYHALDCDSRHHNFLHQKAPIIQGINTNIKPVRMDNCILNTLSAIYGRALNPTAKEDETELKIFKRWSKDIFMPEFKKKVDLVWDNMWQEMQKTTEAKNFNAWLKTVDPSKRHIYLSMHMRDVMKGFSNSYKTHVKTDEKMEQTGRKPPRSRLICGTTSAELGWFVALKAEVLKRTMTHYFSGMNWQDMAKKLKKKWSKLGDPAVLVADYGSFDSSQGHYQKKAVDKPMDQYLLSKLIVAFDLSDYNESELYDQLTDIRVIFHDVHTEIKVCTIIQPSGDFRTSVNNTSRSGIYWLYAAWRVGIPRHRFKVITCGDDSILFYERADRKKWIEAVAIINKLGQTLDIGETEGTLDEFDFISTHAFTRPDGTIRIMRQLGRYLQLTPYTYNIPHNAKDIKKRLKGLSFEVGLADSITFSDLPIFGAYAKMLMRLGKGYSNKADLEKDYGRKYQIWTDKRSDDYDLCCTWMSNKYGITLDEIKDFEEQCENMKDIFGTITTSIYDKLYPDGGWETRANGCYYDCAACA